MVLSIENLKQALVDSGYIAQAQFDSAAQSAQDMSRDIGDVLIFRGLISPDSLNKLVAEYLKVPYVDLTRVIIKDDVLALMPERMARTYRMIPFELDGANLKLAMVDPKNFEAIELTRRHTGKGVAPYFVSEEGLRRALGQYKRNIKKEFEAVLAENLARAKPGEDLQKAAIDLPVVKILDTLIEFAVAERASDVHIETQEERVVVRYRVDGLLEDVAKLERGIEIALVARIKILSNLKLDERRIPQDGRFKFVIDGEAISLRVSVIPGFFGENVVMRLLRESSRPASLQELGLVGHNLEVVSRAISLPHGMVLVTGPTGSGKTTTLYSVMNILNTIGVKIATIEDPIEYGMPRITQIQVNSKAGLTFAAGLRALLRHDPDIIMVGEIRDKETAEIAVQSALTGHLVLSTLHTNNAAGAFPRLLDMGVEDYLVASTVSAVIAQRLVRKTCTACLVEYRPDEAILQRLSVEHGIDLTKQKFYKGGGCQECGGTGFSGRIGIYEALENTETIGKIVAKRGSSDEVFEQAKKEGAISMMVDGVNKVSSGLTTIEEVLKAVLES